jgi:hypothetical protein
VDSNNLFVFEVFDDLESKSYKEMI